MKDLESHHGKESLEIIYKDQDSSLPVKSINKIVHYKDDMFITGGRDASVKIWNNTEDNQGYELLANLKGHIDWVNDMCLNESKTLLFTCSNDNNVHIWKLKGFERNNYTVDIYPINSINEHYTDYVKSLVYNNSSKMLYTGGLDARICAYNIEYSNKSSISITGKNVLYSTLNEKSVYSIDTNKDGSLLVASVYENVSIFS